ncbi:hypothetical protein CPB83DRAFT_850367 [Crepidotus variabilis]|uniref:Pre-mRNA-splicing factor Syf1/CRNKL1-like C-terminal HAT-repeats domain-containing protein n=1 Tax=Crepidotus variabilis TaxID=179855 RepID=A0A9P6EJE9_9AGAR|nr:hypothetical protein CPB83DRAFT_850367 [Crepidotus variabilis]
MFAKFELRRLDLPAARKIFGAAIGMCPKEGLFKKYIELEIELREFDRVRTLYEKYIEFDPSNSSSWIRWAELEAQLQDFPRTRAIFELGVAQQQLAMPEILWKAFIDFEIAEGERERAAELYERLIQLSGHVKVWIAYALFEGEAIPIPREEREDEEEGEEDEELEVKMAPGDPVKARAVFQRAYNDLKSKRMIDERVALLEVWKTFEEQSGTPEDVAKVEGMKPIISKRRRVDQENGQMVEEHVFVFPDDEKESNPTSFKFLQIAHAWAQKKKEGDIPGATSSSKDVEMDENDDQSSQGGDEDDEKSSGDES